MSFNFKVQHNGTIYLSSSRKWSSLSGYSSSCFESHYGLAFTSSLLYNQAPNSTSGLLRHQGGTGRQRGMLRPKRSTQSQELLPSMRSVLWGVKEEGRMLSSKSSMLHKYKKKPDLLPAGSIRIWEKPAYEGGGSMGTGLTWVRWGKGI